LNFRKPPSVGSSISIGGGGGGDDGDGDGDDSIMFFLYSKLRLNSLNRRYRSTKFGGHKIQDATIMYKKVIGIIISNLTSVQGSIGSIRMKLLGAYGWAASVTTSAAPGDGDRNSLADGTTLSAM
jgi:hypothetical protein